MLLVHPENDICHMTVYTLLALKSAFSMKLHTSDVVYGCAPSNPPQTDKNCFRHFLFDTAEKENCSTFSSSTKIELIWCDVRWWLNWKTIKSNQRMSFTHRLNIKDGQSLCDVTHLFLETSFEAQYSSSGCQHLGLCWLCLSPTRPNYGQKGGDWATWAWGASFTYQPIDHTLNYASFQSLITSNRRG